MELLQEKYETLCGRLGAHEAVAVAFSAGVDSSFLLRAAREALGERCVAITANSPLCAPHEIEEARAFCAAEGIAHIEIEFDALALAEVRENPLDRCYWCKRALMEKVRRAAQEWAQAQGYGGVAVVEGSNTDDDADYRPGSRAVAELGIQSPLREAGLSKADIRTLSERLGLLTWNKPSFACLASRVPYGETITREKLAVIDAAERRLRDAGFTQFRVRAHEVGGELWARIEVPPADFASLANEQTAARLNASLRALGFARVTLDLAGYRTGSLNPAR